MTPGVIRSLRVLGGIVLAAVWMAGGAALAALSLIGTLMANDAGGAPASAHTSMILLVLAGAVSASFAGLPLGLACFWRARRRFLLGSFAVLLAAGVLAVAAGVLVFTANLSG